MKYSISKLSLFCLLSATHTLTAAPNIDEKQGLSTPLAEVYSDSGNNLQDESLTFYQMPTKLVVGSNTFTGEKTLSWIDLPNGTALVRMSVAAFHDPLLSLQIIKDLNQTYKKRILFKPFQIKDLSLKQEGDKDLVESVSISVDSGTTQGTFSISFRLTEVGVSVWQALIQSGGLITNPNLTFKVQFTNDNGDLFWEERTLALEISDLPSPNSDSRNFEPAIEAAGTYQGELTYWHQFKDCRSLYLGQEFLPPSPAQLNPPNSGMTPAETSLYAEKVKLGFLSEKARVLATCEPQIQRFKADDWWTTYVRNKDLDQCKSALPSWPEVYYDIKEQSPVFIQQVQSQWGQLSDVCDRLLGRQWMQKFRKDMRITCKNLYDWKFNRVSAALGVASENYKAGVREEYDTFVASCPKVEEPASCDERKGVKCGGSLEGNLMCVSTADIAALNPKDEMSCAMQVFQVFMGSTVTAGKMVQASGLTAKSQGMCVPLTRISSNRDEYRVVIQCQ